MMMMATTMATPKALLEKTSPETFPYPNRQCYLRHAGLLRLRTLEGCSDKINNEGSTNRSDDGYTNNKYADLSNLPLSHVHKQVHAHKTVEVVTCDLESHFVNAMYRWKTTP